MASDQNFLSWPEVTTQPFYQELSDKEKVDLRDKYFTQFVAPTIPQDKLNDGYKEFISNTYLDPESGKELAKTAARESALAVTPTAGAVGLGALARGFARGATSAALEAFPFAAGETAATEGVGALAVPAIELIAGIGGGLYGAYKTAQAQREAINKYVPKETQEEYGLTEEQLAEKAKQYPKTAFAARVAPSLATAGIGVPTTSEALKRAAFSGVLQGGVSAGQQYAETGTIDPKETLMATALGLVQNKPTAFGEAIESRLEGAGQKFGASAQRGLGVNTVFGREAEFVGDPAGAGVFENEPTQPTRLLTGPQATKTAPPEAPPVAPRTPPTPPTVGGDQELSDLLGVQKPKSAAPPVEEPSTITAPTPKPFNDAIADASTDLVEHGGTSADAVNKAVDDAKLGILGESIAAEPGMDVERMAKMLGPQLYGDQSEQAHVTVKELMQNSFDAVKALLDNNSIEKGKIDISTDPTDRSISIIDNGSGMAPKTLATKFLEIAGTQKESDIASGGFGIAKMLTLYANKDIHVTTMRDGKVSELNTTGEDLMKSLSPKSNFPPPSISIRDATPEDRARFPDGHGTHVKITVPENYMSSSNGQKTDIRFLNSYYAPDSVRQSPLFANIDVSYNGRPIENSGSTFPVADYSQWANVKYPWGNARIYVSNEPDPKKATYDNNTYYLSNGLYQFEKKLTKNPGNLFSDAIPYNFYIDLRPNVKPGEAGYPFTFNRKSLTPEAEKDLQKVINYLHKQYSYANAKEDAKSFGGIQYFNKSGKLGKVQNIEPKIAAPKSKFDAISKGDNVEVKNGIVYVGGKEVPELKAEDLKADIPDAGKLTVPQSDIDPNSVMVHDNLTIQTPDGPMEVSNYMRQKFGDRYDKYIHGIGKQFLSLRDIIADALYYPELKEEGVGISIDKEYRGVSIRVPFAASFLNPLIPESPNMLEAAYGFIGTMVHEMAHHKVRSHNASFPAEMQRIEYKLQANKEKEYNAIKRAVVKLVQNNSDIIAEGIRIYAYENISPTRKRLQDSEERIEPSVSYERISKGNGEPSGEIPAGKRVQQPAISGRGASGQRSEAGAGGGRNEKTGPLGGEKTADELRAEMETKEPLRGIWTIKSRLAQAVRDGHLNPEAVDLAEWFMRKNPKLVEDLAVSIPGTIKDAYGNEVEGAAGIYDSINRIAKIIKNDEDGDTVLHEIMHHLERLLPADIQKSLRQEWRRQLLKAFKQSKKGTPEYNYFNALNNFYFGSENLRYNYDLLKMAWSYISDGKVPQSLYALSTPSEFFAVNATRLLQGRMETEINPTVFGRIRQFLSEFWQKIKSLFKLNSDHPVLNAIDSLVKGDGKYKSHELLGNLKGIKRLNEEYDLPTYSIKAKGPKTPDELRAEMEQKLRGKETVDKSAKDRIDELKNKIKGKFSNLDEAWENFKQKQQNAYNEAQRIQNNLDRRGLLKVEGPKRNNPFDILGNMDSKTEWYVNTKVMPQAKAVMNAVHDYGVAKGLTPDEALNTFGGYLKYLSIPERRKELIRRYMPLATKVVPGAAGSELGKSPAVLREMIYDKAMQTMGNQKIPPDQRAAALRGLSNQLDRIVNDTRNHDPRGESYYPHRKVDERGVAAPLPTDTNDDMFMVTAEAEPEKVRAVLELLKKDLDHPVTGPLLEKALDEFGNLRELKKELDRVGGNWTDWLDDLTEHFYQWKNYAPMKARQGEFDPTELEGKRLAGGVSGFEEGMEGGRHLTENPLTQMFYDTMRSASKAGKANLALTIKNLIDSGEVEGKKVGTVKMTDRFLKPDFLDKEAGGDKYLGGDKINYVLPNGDTEVYRLDNQKLLDGIRRKFQELHWALKGSSWLTGGIAKQYTRFRFAFPVKNFLMHTLANSTQLPMHYLGQVGTFQYLNNVAQHLVSGDGFKMFGLFARRGNPKEYAKYLQDHADNQFVQDAHEWMSQGGMAIFEGGLNLKDAQQKLKSLRVKPVHQRVLAALDALLENYNRSWDLVSRVSAYGLVKRVELQNGKSLEEAQTIATRVAKNLANFSLSGGDQSSRVLRSLYAFWAPEMTSKVTALDHLRKMFWTDDNIDKLVGKIAPVSESDDPKVQEQNAKERATARQRLLQERRYAKQGAATMIGSGVFLHFLKNSWAYALAAGGLLTWEQYQKLQEKKEKESRATRSFRIPVTADGETYLDLPYGFPPNNLIGIGEQIGGLADGSQNFKEFGQNTSKIISEFLPKQTSDISPTKDPLTWAAYMVSPTALELPMMLLANKDSRGHSIYNEYATKTPAAYTGGAGVPDQYKTLSIWMYHNLGVDVPPNVAYTFMTSYLDGVHDLLGMGYAANQIATGQGVKATDLKPFAGSFISRRTDAANEDYVGIKSKIEKIGQAFNDPDTEQAAKYIQTHQNEVAAYEIFKGSQGAINKLERDLNTIQSMPNLTPVQKQEYSKQLRDAMDVYKRAIVENAARYGVEP